MRTSVIGCGYLGAVHAACTAELGHDVIGLDVDPDLVDALTRGRAPLYEPGLDDLFRRNLAGRRLRFTTSYDEVAEFADVHFVCVGTPQRADSNAADLTYLDAAIDALGPRLTRPAVVIGKSTVPVGTAACAAARLQTLAPAGRDVELGWSPEFLREGFGVEDTLRPDRIVIGTDSPRVEEAMREVSAAQIEQKIPFLVTDLQTAELVKVAANAFLATKISFINAIAGMCEQVGANVHTAAEALGHDQRIGSQGLAPGLGYGGGCLPKDVRALIASSSETGAYQLAHLLQGVESVNEERRESVCRAARHLCGSVRGSRVAVWGAAFKAGTDDVRDSPALDVASRLVGEGAEVVVYDPQAMDNARKAHPDLVYAPSALDAVVGADVLLHLTGWPEFTEIDPGQLRTAIRHARLVDARGGLDVGAWQASGWEVAALGGKLTPGGRR
ncbi:UDPglucose 6-dehydrogenase [Nocardiopsis mwathae]|uniref:UDP-glucose 6-dehydrogenase n=1 Tax=Nocardiopsis mwathae TaxID=1472723 RepID=A0A7X0D4E5_9ACTN|nr:UDP-glucose/GDP-mannose dehydrogenase family protein [Nocardiopsis mwathae]MBB6171005.1 UDPglucose 6-dehydrogenase [Nocardiopsis mwathae]